MKNQAKFAKKSLGQNFLTSTQVRDGILQEAGDLKGKNVLEIGPGLGFLTEKLLAAGAKVTAVELDERAVNILTKKFSSHPHFTLIHGDILQQNLDELFSTKSLKQRFSNSQLLTTNYQVIANIPYNITNPIIRKLLEKTEHKPTYCLLMVQKEVAQKICAPASKNQSIDSPPAGGSRRGAKQAGENNQALDTPEISEAASKILSIPLQGQPNSKLQPPPPKAQRSILSIAVEVYAQAKYCFTVGREHFEPSPKVDSAIMRFDVRPEPLVPDALRRDFFTVVNAGFSEKRKKIGNVLGKFFGIPATQLLGEIDGSRRAETLSIEEWKALTERFQKLA